MTQNDNEQVKEPAWDSVDSIVRNVLEGIRTLQELEKCGCDNCKKALEVLSEQVKEPAREKVVKVKLRSCITCGAELIEEVRKIDFLGVDGEWYDAIRIESHCGVAGHNVNACTLTRDAFDEAEHNQII